MMEQINYYIMYNIEKMIYKTKILNIIYWYYYRHTEIFFYIKQQLMKANPHSTHTEEALWLNSNLRQSSQPKLVEIRIEVIQ